MDEDHVKDLVKVHLQSLGWQVILRKGQERGMDIEATNGAERWVIEVKGWANGKEQQQGNYFLNALGEILQRMGDDQSRYSIAFPDLPRYKGLWERLPAVAKSRTRISCLFVSQHGRVVEAP